MSLETATDSRTFCEGCIYDDGEDCLRITLPEIVRDGSGDIEFCAGLTY